uniref:Uncharacterized protein n=1 Tax=Ditylenchus dipsaci TaxID=166011 RepID=A0A915D1P1_9BILA
MNVEDPFDLPEVYKLTRSKLRCELFSDPKTGVALFSSDNSLRTAASCKYLAVDATFEYSGKKAGEWISLAFALMEKKEAANYEMIFNAIKEQWNRLAVWTVFA